ncbi:MAG: alanine racemase [Oscillospiraceae bacterium]|nr:alanine racemase [Oscillospiraceae bacterium]
MNSFIIEREKIIANAEAIFSRAGDADVYAVVKGRGYGFGLNEYILLLHECGVRTFAVTDVADALSIKKLNLIDTNVFMLRSTSLSEELAALIENDVILTIGSTEAAVAANDIAISKNKQARVHIKIDTGMGRYGFSTDDIEQIYAAFTKFSALTPCGLYTHLSSAFKSRRITDRQIDELFAIRDELNARNVDCGVVHFANSAYLFKFGDPIGDAVRIGSAFTGRLACKGKGRSLSKVGYLESNICEIHWLSPGSKVGYGGAFTAKKATKTAVIPVGYSDGFHVEKARDTYRFRDCLFYILSDIKRMFFKKSVYVKINGKKAKVLGHIGMTHTVCDITNISCDIGDKAEFDTSPLYVSPDIYREFI